MRMSRRLRTLASVGLLCSLILGFVIQRDESSAKGVLPGSLLYREDFEDGLAQGWDLPPGWRIAAEGDGNKALRGVDHRLARYKDDVWSDLTLTLRVKIIQGSLHIIFRTGGCLRYFVRIGGDTLVLGKTSPCGVHQDLRSREYYVAPGRWSEVRIQVVGGKIDLFVNGWTVLSFVDRAPLLLGGIALESLPSSEVLVDDITVTGSPSEPYAGPLIDAHCHLPVPPGSYLARSVAAEMVAHMDRAGVQAAFIYGLHPLSHDQEDRTILEQAETYPDRLLPFLRGFRLTDPEAASRYVLPQLTTGKWRGLGELYVRHCEAQQVYPADHPALMKVFETAGRHGVPVAIHFEPYCQVEPQVGATELERALAANPKTTFILCHGGMGFVTSERLAAYPNFYVVCEVLPGIADLAVSVFNLWTMAPTRMLVGTDLIPEIAKWGWKDYGHMLEGLRMALGKLPAEAAADVAYRNAARLLGLTVRGRSPD